MLKILAAVLIVISVSTFAAPILCGGAVGKIVVEKIPRQEGEIESIISVSRDGRSTILRYHSGFSAIGMECQKTKSGEPVFVFQAYCTGSACHDLDNYGIIDPEDLLVLLVLLVPSDTNRKDARDILGREPTGIQNIESVSDIGRRLFSK